MTVKNPFAPTIRIGILVYEGFEPIDVWGFTEAFAISRFIGTDYQSPPPYPFEILFISNETRPAGKSSAVPTSVKSSNARRPQVWAGASYPLPRNSIQPLST